MKGIALAASVSVLLVTSGVVYADFTTPVKTGPSNEVPLLGTGNILDTLYGLANVTRIDDFNAPITDQVWYNPDGSAAAEAKYAGQSQNFGYLLGTSGGSPTSLFTVTGSGYLSGTPSAAIPSFSPPKLFRFEDTTGGNTWSSKQADNSGDDHMVTFEITGGPSAGNYVVAFEDKPFGSSDLDYNDLVVEVSGVSPVPVPGAVLLGAAGLGLVGWLKRKALRK